MIDRDGNFVEPTVVEISHDADVVREELFGPVLYVFKIKVSYVDSLLSFVRTVGCWIVSLIQKKHLMHHC